MGLILGNFLPLAALLILLGLPLTLRKIPPNSWYGVRTLLTLENRNAWYDLNERGGKVMVGWGIVLLLAVAGVHLFELEPGAAVSVCLAVVVVGVLGLIVDAAVSSRQWKRRHGKTHQE